MSWYSGLSPLN